MTRPGLSQELLPEESRKLLRQVPCAVDKVHDVMACLQKSSKTPVSETLKGRHQTK